MDKLVEERRVIVNSFGPSHNPSYFSCECGSSISNKDIYWTIRIERWNNSSYESIVSGELKLAGQKIITMCNNCYQTIKE